MEAHPVLAEAADVLGDQLRAHLRRLSKLVKPGVAKLERRFMARLQKLHFDQIQRKALAAITPGAAASLLGRRKPLSQFFEQVEYNGRRLAKLNLPPGSVVRALREYDRLLTEVLGELPKHEHDNLLWVREQLHFCIVLTCTNAFYQVREAETQAYSDLFHAELESQSVGELLQRLLGVLVRFCQAEEGRLFLLDEDHAAWTLRAATNREHQAQMPTFATLNTPARYRSLSRSRHIEAAVKSKRLLLDPSWPGRHKSFWSIPLVAEGQTMAVIQFAFENSYRWLPRELELLSAAAELCLQAAEKARLLESLAASEERVRALAENVLLVEEMERRRISHELHDEAGQSMLCIRLQLEMLERTVPEECKELRSGLKEVRQLAERTIVETRRLIADLSPAILEQLGLAAALRQTVTRFRRVHPCQVRLRIGRLPSLPKRIETVVYRLVQECCNNIAKHSSASRVNISVGVADKVLRLDVEDDGVGFRVEEVLEKRDSYGLMGVRERVVLFGGECDLQSGPDSGTVISIRLPVEE